MAKILLDGHNVTKFTQELKLYLNKAMHGKKRALVRIINLKADNRRPADGSEQVRRESHSDIDISRHYSPPSLTAFNLAALNSRSLSVTLGLSSDGQKTFMSSFFSAVARQSGSFHI